MSFGLLQVFHIELSWVVTLVDSSGRCSKTTVSCELNSICLLRRKNKTKSYPSICIDNSHSATWIQVIRVSKANLHQTVPKFQLPPLIKKRIVRCLQLRAKAISSDCDVYQEGIKSLKDNFHRNNYPESITSVPRNLDQTTENDTRNSSQSALCQRPSKKKKKKRIWKIVR